MGITIQQLHSNTPGPPPPPDPLLAGQVVVTMNDLTPEIVLNQVSSSIGPCYVSETQPTIGASNGGLWYKPSTSQLYIGIKSEYKPAWANLFGCTTEDSTIYGAWFGGGLTGEGPKYYTGISNNNPRVSSVAECKGVYIGLNDRNPLNGGRNLNFVSINGQDDYNGRLPDESVTINSNSSARGDGAVRIGFRAGAIDTSPQQTISSGTYTAVGTRAGYESAVFADFTTFGWESGEFTRPVTSAQSTATLLGGPKGSGGGASKRPIDEIAWIGDGNTFVPDDITGRDVPFSNIVHFGRGNEVASNSLIIGSNFKVSLPAQTRSTVICNGTFAANPSFGQVSMGGVSTGGSLYSTSVSLCNGLGQALLTVTENGLRFKGDPSQSAGQVLMSQGSAAPPKWATLPDGFFVDSLRREVTIKGGFIVNITNPI